MMGPQTWQTELRQARTSITEVTDTPTGAELAVEEKYRTLVPDYYLSLIDRDDPNDPIAKMALPSAEELVSSALEVRDPIGDLERKAAPRLTHRYRNRALLHLTNTCPMYCRFCFRKNLMNEREADLYKGDFAAAFVYLEKHPEVEELIFTGGDPWTLSDEKLSALVDAVDVRLPQVKKIRFHTRMPVTLPTRVQDSLLGAITRPGRFQTVVITHFNHPREVTELARAAAAKIWSRGITLFNQSVLLRGVNDDPKVLADLFERLGASKVQPYYLHHPDQVVGAAHFRISIARGQKIWGELRSLLPGYLVPQYVLDCPEGVGKVPVHEPFVTLVASSPNEYLVRRDGKEVRYTDLAY